MAPSAQSSAAGGGSIVSSWFSAEMKLVPMGSGFFVPVG
jgi:hypothetical protein